MTIVYNLVKRKNIYLNLIPSFGIIIFFGLYYYSSTLYPGGSQANKFSEGFDWVNNYWCNLMDTISVNGEINPARPYAIFAMILLCLSLMVFFIDFAIIFSANYIWKRMIQISGIFSMFFATLVFTEHHDVMILLSSSFGVLVLIGIIREIYKNKMTFHKIFGILSFLLLIYNNYLFFTHQLTEILPLLQKISFAIVLLWFMGLNIEIFNRQKEKMN